MSLQALLPLACPCGDRDFGDWTWSLVVDQIEGDTMYSQRLAFQPGIDSDPTLFSERLSAYAEISDEMLEGKLGQLRADRMWSLLLDHVHDPE